MTLRAALLALSLARVLAMAEPQATMRNLGGPTDARCCATQSFRARASGVVERFAINRADRKWRNAVHAGGHGRAFQTWQHGFVHHAFCKRDAGNLDCYLHVTPCRVNVNAASGRGITCYIPRR